MGLRYNPSISITVTKANGLEGLGASQIDRNEIGAMVKRYPQLVRFHLDKKFRVRDYLPTLDFLRSHMPYSPELYETRIRRRNENVLVVHHLPSDNFYLLGDRSILEQYNESHESRQ